MTIRLLLLMRRMMMMMERGKLYAPHQSSEQRLVKKNLIWRSALVREDGARGPFLVKRVL